jgi:2-methylcitrate dehydratase PrpD
MTKPLHAGLAARSGVEAALLASRGFTASTDGLAGRYGFCSVLDGGEPADLGQLEPARFGKPWEISEPYGLAIKQFPSCGATHPAIEAALELVHGDGVPSGDIERVRVGTTALAPKILVYDRPASGLEGKFSLQYCVATALVEGRVGLDHFEDGAIGAPEVRALVERIDAEVDDRVRDDPEYATIITVTLRDGSSRERRVDLAKGKTSRPLSRDELRSKYSDCAGRVLSPAAVEHSRELLEGLDGLESVAVLVGALEVE